MHVILKGGAYGNGSVAACEHQSSLYGWCAGGSMQHQETFKQRKDERQNVHAAKHQLQLAPGTKMILQNGMMR